MGRTSSHSPVMTGKLSAIIPVENHRFPMSFQVSKWLFKALDKNNGRVLTESFT